MLFNPNVLKSLIKQQSNAIRNFNKMLGCHRPDAAKVKYDAEQVAKNKRSGR